MFFLNKKNHKRNKYPIAKYVLCLQFIFTFGLISGQVFAENSDYKFYAFNNIKFSDEKKSLEENRKFLLALLFPKKNQKYLDIKIPDQIIEKYLLPKKETKLYLFVDSKYKGSTEPVNYNVYEHPAGAGMIFSYEVDKSKIKCSDEKWMEYYQSGVFVSRMDGKEIKYFKSSQFFNLGNQSQPILSLKETYEIVQKVAPEIDGISKHSCLNDYNVSSTLSFPNENASVIFLKSKTDLYNHSYQDCQKTPGF